MSDISIKHYDLALCTKVSSMVANQVIEIDVSSILATPTLLKYTQN